MDFKFQIFRFVDDFRLVTAVLSGDKCLEMRVFAVSLVTISVEKKLTRMLCRLMDRNSNEYRRYMRFVNFININLFRLKAIFMADEVPGIIKPIQRKLQTFEMSIQMVDASQSRFIDLYCIKTN